MTERSPTGGERRFTDRELEAALRDLGGHLAYPPTADLLPAVRARIARHAGPSFWDLVRSPRLSFAPALATLGILVLATLAFQPVATTAAEALGLRGIAIFRVGEPVPPSSGAAILPDARRVASAEGASREAGFAVRTPSALGRPDEVYVRTGDGSTFVVLVYGPRTGISVSARTGVSVLVTEVRGAFEAPLLGKAIGPGARAEQLVVNGGAGVWIEGEPHQFFFRTPNGDIAIDSLRLAGNTLVWEQDGLLLRVEADIPRDQALRIAASFR